MLWQDERYVYFTYFNAGSRVRHPDERAPKEVGWFLPPDRSAARPAAEDLPRDAIRDVVVDAREIFLCRIKNHGVYILSTGSKQNFFR